MGELSRRGVKAFAVLSFMAFTSCAIAGTALFHLFTPLPHHAARAMQPTIRAERSHLSCGTGPRASLNDVSQRGHLGGECSKAGEAVSKTAWVGSIPTYSRQQILDIVEIQWNECDVMHGV